MDADKHLVKSKWKQAHEKVKELTAQQLATDMNAAQVEEFGPSDNWIFNTATGPDVPSPVCPYPTKYFDSDVVIVWPDTDETKDQVNPSYCASIYGAMAMCDVVRNEPGGDPTVGLYLDWPSGAPYEGVEVSQKVPWLRNAEGQRANCGLMLAYFTHGYPANKAFAAAMGEFRPMPE